jgi:hypothetical protein
VPADAHDEAFSNRLAKIVPDINANSLSAQNVDGKLGFIKLRANQNAWKDQSGVWQTPDACAPTPERLVPLALWTWYNIP